MQLSEEERSAVNNAALTEENSVQVAGHTVRKMVLGSVLQLQRIGNPYGRLGELDFQPDDKGNVPSMWEVLGIKDKAAMTYFVAEFVWVHAEAPERVRRGLNLTPEGRREMVEEFMMRFNIKDFPELELAILLDTEKSQGGMTNPDGSGGDEEDPLGRGRHGERP